MSFGGYPSVAFKIPRKRARPSFVAFQAPRKRAKRAPYVQRGFTRTGGFYGRYSGKAPELKFHDISLSDSSISSGGSILLDSWNKIAQGVTESQRVGRKIRIKKIMWRGKWDLPTTTTVSQTSDTIRVILYLDKQCNGATAAVTDVLESASINAFRNLANSGRFSILWDRYVTVVCPSGAGSTTTYGEQTRKFFFSKSCDIPVEFDSTTGAITEIKSNNIGLLVVSDGGFINLVSRVRIRFSDGA